MLEINVNVRFPDLPAVEGLLEKILQTQKLPVLNDLVNRQPTVSNIPAPEAAPVLPTTVASGPDVPKATLAEPPAVAPVEPPKAPTEAPSFTLAQISTAGADLVTRKPELIDALSELLGRYGAKTVVELKPESFGAFAAELRAMGGKI